MKRMHIHISVDNLPESIQFYSTLFASQPSVLKTDYAKWMLEDPRVNFAISKRGAALGLNHLGLQVESAEELAEMNTRLQALQGEVTAEMGTACCYAKSDKYWVNDPEGLAWETFHTLDSIPVFGSEPLQTTSDCCVPLAVTSSNSACCVPNNSNKATGSGCC